MKKDLRNNEPSASQTLMCKWVPREILIRCWLWVRRCGGGLRFCILTSSGWCQWCWSRNHTSGTEAPVQPKGDPTAFACASPATRTWKLPTPVDTAGFWLVEQQRKLASSSNDGRETPFLSLHLLFCKVNFPTSLATLRSDQIPDP